MLKKEKIIKCMVKIIQRKLKKIISDAKKGKPRPEGAGSPSPFGKQ
jgi:hypothetical protein